MEDISFRSIFTLSATISLAIHSQHTNWRVCVWLSRLFTQPVSLRDIFLALYFDMTQCKCSVCVLFICCFSISVVVTPNCWQMFCMRVSRAREFRCFLTFGERTCVRVNAVPTTKRQHVQRSIRHWRTSRKHHFCLSSCHYRSWNGKTLIKSMRHGFVVSVGWEPIQW